MVQAQNVVAQSEWSVLSNEVKRIGIRLTSSLHIFFTEQGAVFHRLLVKERRLGPMRIGRRVVKIVFWGMLLSLSIAGGALWFAYSYMTDSETAARLIREHAIKYFPGSLLEPGRVRIRPLIGEVVLHQLQLLQRIDGTPFEVLRIPWLNIRINTRKLAKGELEAKEIVVSLPTLRLKPPPRRDMELERLARRPMARPVDQHTADSHSERDARADSRR